MGVHSGPTSEVDLDCPQLGHSWSQAERDCSALVEQVLSAVDMADQRMLVGDSFAGFGYLVGAASVQVASHPFEVEEHRGWYSDRAQGPVQVQIGSETALDGIAAAPVAAAAPVVEACNSDSQVVAADGRIEWEADEGVADKAFDMQRPCWDYKVLAGECSTMSFVTSFAWDPLPEWMSMSKQGLSNSSSDDREGRREAARVVAVISKDWTGLELKVDNGSG